MKDRMQQEGVNTSPLHVLFFPFFLYSFVLLTNIYLVRPRFQALVSHWGFRMNEIVRKKSLPS